MRGGKSAMAKLESRIRELEIELGNVQSKTGENMKAHQRSERKIKELQFQNDEDRKNQDRMSDLASKLQRKDQGAPVPERRGQEEPGPHVRPGLQAAAEDRNLQEADRGGRGDRRPQPGQVPQGPAGAGGDRGPCQDGRECSSLRLRIF